MDMSQYRELFVSESREHIRAFNDLIVQLESSGAVQDIIDELFRHAHSLKGMAATMQIQPIADLAHKMEDLMSKVRSREFLLTPAMADLMLEGSDTLAIMISMIEAGDDQLPDSTGLVNRLERFTPETSPPTLPTPIAGTAESGTDVRDHPAPRQLQPSKSGSSKNIRIRTEVLDHLVNITGELITSRYQLFNQVQQYPEAKLEEPLNQLSSMLRQLRDTVFQARMLPFASVAERFPRLVRDLARQQGKEIALQMEGKEIELDRAILEEIAEPLVHILRNAVDHGMELPEERMAAGKQRTGSIGISVTRVKDHVNIVIADDGHGMDHAFIAAKAVEKGVISRAQADAMTYQELLMLVCAPGFSTAESVSDISGRGVGMDAVKSAIHRLGGNLSIETEIGQGSRFTIKLPITVSIINALLVRCGDLTVAFPVNAIDKTVELKRNEIFEKEGQEFCIRDERCISLKNLNPQLGQPLPKVRAPFVPAIVTGMGGTPAGLLTDRVLGQQEIFVKPLGAPLSRMRGVTGGTVLGDGRIIFVLDINCFA